MPGPWFVVAHISLFALHTHYESRFSRLGSDPYDLHCQTAHFRDLEAQALALIVPFEPTTGAFTPASSCAQGYRLQSSPHWILLASTALLLSVT